MSIPTTERKAKDMSKQILTTSKLATPAAPFSMGTKAGGIVFCAGLVATDKAGNVVGVNDIKAQTRQILENMREVLTAGGASFADVTKTTVYLTDIANYGGMNEVYREFFLKEPPARATVKADLLNKDFLIEIDAFAVPG